MRVRSTLIALPVLSFLQLACANEVQKDETQIATLYRQGALLTDIRLQVATFNAKGEANDYNFRNCDVVAGLINESTVGFSTVTPGQKVAYWCEPGEFKEDGVVPKMNLKNQETQGQKQAVEQ